jgi:hypothetical protein
MGMKRKVRGNKKLWEPPTFIQVEMHFIGNVPIIRYPRKQMGKHILEVPQ